jgi:hypothetical protein
VRGIEAALVSAFDQEVIETLSSDVVARCRMPTMRAPLAWAGGPRGERVGAAVGRDVDAGAVA